MYTYLGVQWNNLTQTPKEIIQVDADHRIKVYQHVGTSRLLYVPQHKTGLVAIPWDYYREKTDCEGSYDSWATWDMDEAVDKMFPAEQWDEQGNNRCGSWEEEDEYWDVKWPNRLKGE